MRLIDAYFSIYNPILTVVDEDSFRASLKSAGRIDAHQRDPSVPLSMSDMFSNAEGYGFRVLFFTLLTVGSRASVESSQSDSNKSQYAPFSSASAYYFNLARRYLGPCFTAPTKHLISSLLLMTLITRTWMRTHEAYLHAELAHRLLPMVKDATPNLIAATKILVASNKAFQLRADRVNNDEGTIPHLSKLVVSDPENAVDPLERFCDILSFLMAFLINDCQGTFSNTNGEVGAESPSERVPLCTSGFVMLMTEAESIQKQRNLFPGFPLQIMLYGCSAIMKDRLGDAEGTLSDIIACVDLINKNKFARFCFPVVLTVMRFMHVLRSALKLDGSSDTSPYRLAATKNNTESDAKIKRVAIDACKFLKASRSTTTCTELKLGPNEKLLSPGNPKDAKPSSGSNAEFVDGKLSSLLIDCNVCEELKAVEQGGKPPVKQKRPSESKEEMQGFGMSMASMTAAIAPKVRRMDLMSGVHEMKPLSIRASGVVPEPFAEDPPPVYETPKESNDFGFHIKPALIEGLESPVLTSSHPLDSGEDTPSQLRKLSMQSHGSLEFPSPLLAPVSSNDPTSVPLSLLFQETFGDDLFEEFERDALALADSSSHDDSSPVSGGESGKSSEVSTEKYDTSAESAGSYEASEDFDKIFPSMDDVEMFVS
jgi:hypothetical protein